jgi:hypothetical protein
LFKKKACGDHYNHSYFIINLAHFWPYKWPEFSPSPTLNLNIDKNRSTSGVGGFPEIDAASRICSDPHPP